MNNKQLHILNCTNINKSYVQGPETLHVLRDINLVVAPGETISIVGSSGSGKSTLLHILAGLDKPTSGHVHFSGTEINTLSDDKRCILRNKNVGFIYQFHHLLAEFTALENVLMPLMINGANNDPESLERAHIILDRLGLAKRLMHYPGQLSGGERQRVAIARAVVNNPKLIFADEPTGNLDNQTASNVLSVFFKLQQELGTSVVLVTHDMNIAKETDSHYKLHDGHLVRR